MNENYINILTGFLGEALENKKITLPEVVALLKEFEPICERIQNRKDLMNFVDFYTPKIPYLKVLKEQLQDETHIFKIINA